MSKDDLRLSRRKLLAGVGTAGVAAAGAGLGTTAYLSDTESFDGNSMTAGTLDMSVTATLEAADAYWAGQVGDGEGYEHAIDGISTTADGEVVAGLSVDDVKPGDWALIRFDIEVEDNPAYVRTRTENLESSENGFEEPEPEVTADEGELEDQMEAAIYGEPSGSGVGSNNDANPPYSYLDNSSLDPTTPAGSTVQDVYDTYSTGVVVRDGNGDAVEVGTGNDAATWYLVLDLPSDVGNVIQGDSFSFDLVFEAVQARHNDASDPTFNASGGS